MTQRSRFFDSTAGDRIYNADAMAEVIYALMGDGVVAGREAELVVSESSPAAMSVRVGLGSAFVRGRFLEVYATAETMAIAPAHASLPRIDRVVVRRDLTARTMALAVITGTPAASPAIPALTQVAAGIWEIPLARVAVAAATTSIVNANITDERGARAQGPDIASTLSTATGHDHDATDSKAVGHGSLTGLTADQHHAQSHATRHVDGGADELAGAISGFVRTGANVGGGITGLTGSFATLLSTVFTKPAGWNSYRIIAWGEYAGASNQSATDIEARVLIGGSANPAAEEPTSIVPAGLHVHPVGAAHGVSGLTASTTTVAIQGRVSADTGGTNNAGMRWLAYIAIRES